MGFREFQEIRGFGGLNSRLRVVDGVDCVYGVSIRVNANDGNDVGTDRAISRTVVCQIGSAEYNKVQQDITGYNRITVAQLSRKICNYLPLMIKATARFCR